LQVVLKEEPFLYEGAADSVTFSKQMLPLENLHHKEVS